MTWFAAFGGHAIAWGKVAHQVVATLAVSKLTPSARSEVDRLLALEVEVFPNAACVVSLIDRLVHHSEVIGIEGESYRLKEAQARSAEMAAKRKRAKS